MFGMKFFTRKPFFESNTGKALVGVAAASAPATGIGLVATGTLSYNASKQSAHSAQANTAIALATAQRDGVLPPQNGTAPAHAPPKVRKRDVETRGRRPAVGNPFADAARAIDRRAAEGRASRGARKRRRRSAPRDRPSSSWSAPRRCPSCEAELASTAMGGTRGYASPLDWGDGKGDNADM